MSEFEGLLLGVSIGSGLSALALAIWTSVKLLEWINRVIPVVIEYEFREKAAKIEEEIEKKNEE